MADSRWRLINVILLGLGFMLVFTAFQTTSMISKYVTSSLKEETKNTTEFQDIYDEKINDKEFMSGDIDHKNHRYLGPEVEIVKCKPYRMFYISSSLGCKKPFVDI